MKAPASIVNRRDDAAARSAARLGPPLLVDAHVHCHRTMKWADVLEAAAHNFRSEAEQLGISSSCPGCLLLAESQGVHRFRELRARGSAADWSVHHAREAQVVVCHGRNGQVIVVVAGRQIVTRERLEVLALSCDHHFVDRQPIVGIIQQINALGGVAVVPWGFGKWRFRRGRIVRRLIDSYGGSFLLGDNGGRARISRRPRAFARAESKGIAVLPGSDPLPFRSELSRVGSYGFVLDVSVDESRPAEAIVHALRSMRASPKCYGRRTPWGRAAVLQVAMQVKKRMTGRET